MILAERMSFVYFEQEIALRLFVSIWISPRPIVLRFRQGKKISFINLVYKINHFIFVADIHIVKLKKCLLWKKKE